MDNADRGIRKLLSINDPIEDNEYRIALKTGSGEIYGNLIEDYHFMRQDEDGKWSHMPGVNDILYLDEGLTPSDVTWDLYSKYGDIIQENFYSNGIVYFAIQYE